jgi:Zeta toxin
MLNFRFRGQSSDLPAPVSPEVPADEGLDGMYERVFKKAWDPAEHPRGQPDNAGQFVEAGGGEAGGGVEAGGGASKDPPVPDPPPLDEINARIANGMGVAEAFGKGTQLQEGSMPTDQQLIERHLNAKQREVFATHSADMMARVKAGDETHKKYAASGPGGNAVEEKAWEPERDAQNEALVLKLVTEKEAAATPEDGKPTFSILAGRGGSGKSKFELGESVAGFYDKKKALVIDADEIKLMLLERDGLKGQAHLAFLYHEESSHIADRMLEEARARGMNVVYDATMKSHKPEIPRDFKEANYHVRAAMIHLPIEEAAGRALERHARGTDPKKGETGRLVPPVVIKSNTNNEKNFDLAIAGGNVDEWELWDNRGGGPKTPPRLIANSKGGGYVKARPK